MKLAVVTAYPPSKITLNEYGYHLVKHFRLHKEVTELILLTDFTQGDKDLNFNEAGCTITVKPCWKFNSYSNPVSIVRALSQTGAEAVFFNLQFLKFGDKKIPAALGLLTPVLSKLKGLPTITLIHNILEEVDLDKAGFTKNKLLTKVYGIIGATLTRLILGSDLVAVTISKYVRVLKAKYKANNIILVPHGSFEIPPEPDYSLPKGPKQVMAFGKFGTYKKVELMIEAVEEIRKKSEKSIEIVIAGTDSPNTPGYLQSIKERYRHVTNLRFTGYVEENQVPNIFAHSAVVVFPYTTTTGSSGVLHQAGSYGKAVVMPDLGDLGILVREEGYAGEFFNPHSVDSLAKAIEKILKDDTYRVKLGKSNYKAACALPMSEITNRYINYFKDIAARKKSPFTLSSTRESLVEYADL